MSEKMDMTSMDVTKKNIEILKKLFPNIVKEITNRGGGYSIKG